MTLQESRELCRQHWTTERPEYQHEMTQLRREILRFVSKTYSTTTRNPGTTGRAARDTYTATRIPGMGSKGSSKPTSEHREETEEEHIKREQWDEPIRKQHQNLHLQP